MRPLSSFLTEINLLNAIYSFAETISIKLKKKFLLIIYIIKNVIIIFFLYSLNLYKTFHSFFLTYH